MIGGLIMYSVYKTASENRLPAKRGRHPTHSLFTKTRARGNTLKHTQATWCVVIVGFDLVSGIGVTWRFVCMDGEGQAPSIFILFAICEESPCWVHHHIYRVVCVVY